jgi:hypothetical protein
VLSPGGTKSVLHFCLHLVTRLTGSTVTRIVASRATISDMKARLIMMSHSFFVGVHSSGIDAFSSPLDSTSTIMLGFCMSSGVTGCTVTAVACFEISSLSLSPTDQALAFIVQTASDELHLLFSSNDKVYVDSFFESRTSMGVEARFVDADQASESLGRRDVAPFPAGDAMTCSCGTNERDR